jgi:hypothetical protein
MEVPSRFGVDDALWAEIEPLIPPRVDLSSSRHDKWPRIPSRLDPER